MAKLLPFILLLCALNFWAVPFVAAAQQWEIMFDGAPVAPDPGPRVLFFSGQFLGRTYAAGTLGGGEGQHEALVINLKAVDCFTLLDYVEALRRSPGRDDFENRLIQVRYRDGMVDWTTRRHFFSDWRELPGMVDVTEKIGGAATRAEEKQLNRRADGQPWLAGVPLRKRSIDWIPAQALMPVMLGRLRDGDYIGIYSPEAGLDVSHVGIAILKEGEPFLRHASPGKGVVDSRLADYLKGRPGIVVLRPLPL